VAVIDSGVTPQPRLANLNPGGDYIDPAADGLVDCDGHGTVVAGIIAAQPGADGFSGVAPEAALVSIRQSSAQWSPKIPSGGDPQQVKTAGDVATLARAVRHAADMPGVRVINISLIDCIPSYKQVDQAALGAALRYAAIDKDIVVVAAAGNTGESNCESNPLTDPNRPDDPRNWAAATTISTPCYWQPYVLSVGSLTPEGQPSNFTMAGPWVGIAAPGEQIVSLGNAPNSGLVNGQPSNKEPLAPINGTSFAAAYVSGAAALVRSAYPDLTARQIVNRLVASAHNAARSPSNLVGAGVIDPVAALTWDIPEGEEVPAQMPVVRVPPPAPPPPDDRLPRLIAFGVGITAIAAALIAVTMIGLRRDRNNG
ncbi:MAG TPA: type VII secretion-associated serine protease mycosin, partial [Mycobacterium sp.]